MSGDWRQQLSVLVTEPWADHELIDTGGGRKLERYGPVRVIRPEPQALWAPHRPSWKADAEFIGAPDDSGGGRWQLYGGVPESWPLAWDQVRFHASCTPFRHLAFFPDMAAQWRWMAERLEAMPAGAELLNLFGYTGVASLVAARAGARVTHVDASKKAIGAAVENQRLSGLDDRPIRWIVDDAMKFVAREGRRGRRYQGVIVDPPKYGRGPTGEIWHLTEDLPRLLHEVRGILALDGPAFMILTVYAVRLSALALGEAVAAAFEGLPGGLSVGEMALRESARGRLLPTALTVRWLSTNP